MVFVERMSPTSSSVIGESLARLRALKIEAADIPFVEHDGSSTHKIQGQPDIENLPPRTIVKVVLSPAPGSRINVEIWLPDADTWNGCLLGLGNGGAAGCINHGALAGALRTGYVAAHTDMGTAPNADSGIGNREVWKDFGYRATHLMTVAAKQVLKAHYGRKQEYSYFCGGSTGGQQGLQEAQRYPDDYDGIVATIAAHCRTPLHAYFLWNDQILTKCPFTEAQEANVIAAGNEYMAPREAPPVAGKFVSDPRCDSKDIEAVIALALQKDPTLTQAHAEALRKLFDGPKSATTGERIFNGIPFGGKFEGARRNLYLFNWVFGATQNLNDLNFGADIDTYFAELGPHLNAENPDLSQFEKRGGKLIVTEGTADSVVPYHASIDYYERVIAHFGSLEKAQSFFRLYVVPGLAHGDDPGINRLPDLVQVVRDWRETGTAPHGLTGQRIIDGQAVLTMPVYPYPVQTGWDAATSSFKPVEGKRGGVERIAERFRPPPAE